MTLVSRNGYRVPLVEPKVYPDFDALVCCLGLASLLVLQVCSTADSPAEAISQVQQFAPMPLQAPSSGRDLESSHGTVSSSDHPWLAVTRDLCFPVSQESSTPLVSSCHSQPFTDQSDLSSLRPPRFSSQSVYHVQSRGL
jgi:hypothetical protein